MRKGLMTALAVLLVGIIAVPANAARPAEVGVFAGRAEVGKTIASGVCTNDAQTLVVGGTGLGLPALKIAKYGYWTIKTASSMVGGVVPGFFRSVPGGTGSLTACGELLPGLLAVGAACGVSTGARGFGNVTYDSGPPVIKLRDVGWVTSVGGTLPVQGNIAGTTAKKEPIGKVLALVQAQGGAPCVSKTGGSSNSNKSGGAIAFDVVGVFVGIAPNK